MTKADDDWFRAEMAKARATVPSVCTVCGCNSFRSNERNAMKGGEVQVYWTCIRCDVEALPASRIETIAAEVLKCAVAHEPNVLLMGNVRAHDIAKLAAFVAERRTSNVPTEGYSLTEANIAMLERRAQMAMAKFDGGDVALLVAHIRTLENQRSGSASADLEATAAEAERMRDESDERLRTTLLAIEHDIIAGGNLREILGRIERVVGKPGDPRRGDGLVTPCARPAEESELDSPPFKPLSLTELEARGFKRHGRTIMVGGFAPGNEAPNARAVELRETPSLHDASGHTGVYACSWCDAESKDVATVPHREGCQLAAIVARYLDLAGQSGSPDRGGSP